MSKREQSPDGVSAHLFILGTDYHLGDLLWFTAVARAYRGRVHTSRLSVCLPDREISRILERNPSINEVHYGDSAATCRALRRRFGDDLAVHDLRPLPLALEMMRQWRRRLPWLYYRDLWLEPRGQWLATFLGLGELHDYRPSLHLTDDDRAAARALPSRCIALAPHIGQYSLPLAGDFWRRIKGWPRDHWIVLADRLRGEGYYPITLAASGQPPIPGTTAAVGLPIRQVAGIIERASALVSVESGLWFIAAALDVPCVVVPWWLPRSVDWIGPTGVPHARIFRHRDSVDDVLTHVNGLVGYDPAS